MFAYITDLRLNDLRLSQNTFASVLKFIFVIFSAAHTDIRFAPFQFTMYSHFSFMKHLQLTHHFDVACRQTSEIGR